MMSSGLVGKASLFTLGLMFVSIVPVNAKLSTYQFCRNHYGEQRTVYVHYLSPEGADSHDADLTEAHELIDAVGSSEENRIIGIFDVRQPDADRPAYDALVSAFLKIWMAHDSGAWEQYDSLVKDGRVAVRRIAGYEAFEPDAAETTVQNITTMVDAFGRPFASHMNDIFRNAGESEHPFRPGFDLWYQEDITPVIFTNYGPESFVPFFTAKAVDRSIERKLRPFYYWYSGCALMPR